MAYLCVTGGLLQENCYILYDESTKDAAVIDPGFMKEPLEKAFEPLHVRCVLLTHGHFDHMMGAEAVKARTGAEIICLDKEKELVENAALNGSKMLLRREITALVDRVLKDGEEFFIGNIPVRVMHTPGHTAGGCCYITPDAVFTGDTLMKGSCGRTDLPTGDGMALMQSLRKIAALEEDLAVLPGHGPASTMAVERQFNPYL